MPLITHANGALAAAVLFFFLAPQSASAQTSGSPSDQHETASAAASSSGELPMQSDRDKAGLHGPVEECTLETITPPGPTSRAWRMVYTTKYDRNGRMYEHGYINNDGSKGVESLTYDAEGHLLRTVWDSQQGKSDTIYTYDVSGKLISITGPRDWSTTFEYDDRGRKTRILKSTLEASSTATEARFGGANLDSDDLFVVPPAGGTVRTSFNERDQATESKAYAATGDLVSQFTRRYDAKGRVAEVSFVIENLALLLPLEARERLEREPGAAEEMKQGMVITRLSFTYDEQDRVVEKRQRSGFARETITKITYNNYGDKIGEIATASGDLNPPKNKDGKLSADSPEPRPLPDEHSDTRFDYKYDAFGNWIEQTVSSPPGANESSKTWSIQHRTITYY